ncbi:MAG: hypothetical protein H6983_25225 [Ectothiorhodospiraceae bacterium]|nr:hypothetical protein [Chromatiales bacterium]MCP5157502.1 hypothetical protein [Ectothiorhodospiraceae bacterium]
MADDDQYWFGYIEAGAKSSPVLLDRSLDTANSETVYLFNLKRGEIIEYRREIVEAKLRALGEDAESEQALRDAYPSARRGFQPRSTVRLAETETTTSTAASADDEDGESDAEEVDDLDGDLDYGAVEEAGDDDSDDEDDDVVDEDDER